MTDMRRHVFTPATLAERWGCSDGHVRNMIVAGKLRAFRIGDKLIRIPLDAVEEFECQNIASDGSGAGSSSSSMQEDGASVTRLEPLTRAKLNAVRQRSTPS